MANSSITKCQRLGGFNNRNSVLIDGLSALCLHMNSPLDSGVLFFSFYKNSIHIGLEPTAVIVLTLVTHLRTISSNTITFIRYWDLELQNINWAGEPNSAYNSYCLPTEAQSYPS